MAQLVARFHGMEEVRGSNPLSSTHTDLGPLRTEGADVCHHALIRTIIEIRCNDTWAP